MRVAELKSGSVRVMSASEASANEQREVDQKSYAYEQVMKNAHGKFNSPVKFDVNMHIYS